MFPAANPRVFAFSINPMTTSQIWVAEAFKTAFETNPPQAIISITEDKVLEIKPHPDSLASMRMLVTHWNTKAYEDWMSAETRSEPINENDYCVTYLCKQHLLTFRPMANHEDELGFFKFHLVSSINVTESINNYFAKRKLANEAAAVPIDPPTKKEVTMNEVVAVTAHNVPGAGPQLAVHATDAQGSGGAHHRYEITGLNMSDNPAADDTGLTNKLVIPYQQGPVPAVGVNGVTIEAVVATAVHRLECFQAGPFASADNQEALELFRKGIEALNRRTLARIARNVEGKEVA